MPDQRPRPSKPPRTPQTCFRLALAAARERLAAAQGGANSELATKGALVADTRIATDCPIDEPYVPTEEELAANNADTDGLAAAFDTAGISYTVITDDLGFTYLEYNYDDANAQSVADAYWNERYPIEPPAQEDLDRVRSDNDAIAAALDAAGLSYTRSTDELGWDSIEWDYEDPAAQAAVDTVYAELYPPQPPTADDIAYMTAENDRLAAAFDAAGIAYTRMSDELGWTWIEWDYNDESLFPAVQAVFDELYPATPGDACLIAD
ncbi:MAG: hypothetical protein R2706_05505 [Acidimicrobiales bacterium]